MSDTLEQRARALWDALHDYNEDGSQIADKVVELKYEYGAQRLIERALRHERNATLREAIGVTENLIVGIESVVGPNK